MKRINREDGDKRFHHGMAEWAKVVGRTEIDLAKSYFAANVGTDARNSDRLIRDWWQIRGHPPVNELIYDDDYGFDLQVELASRHWQARLSAAQALYELVSGGYLQAEGSSTLTQRVQQPATDVTPESGGGWSGAVALDAFSVNYPSSVKRGPYAKDWDGPPAPDAATLRWQPPVAALGRPLGVISRTELREQAISQLDALDADLRALVDSATLTSESKRLIEEQAYELVDQLRDILRRTTENENERRTWIKGAAHTGGRLFGTLHGAARLTAPFTGVLASAPDAIHEGTVLVESVLAALG